VDFVLVTPGKDPLAIECKWSSAGFEPTNFLAFQKRYPASKCYVISHDVQQPYQRRYRDTLVHFTGLSSFVETLLT